MISSRDLTTDENQIAYGTVVSAYQSGSCCQNIIAEYGYTERFIKR
jgi:hypothetical protein